MKDALNLLEQLRTRGVELWADAGQIHYRAFPGTLTPELICQLKAHKAELLSHLPDSSGDRITRLPEQPDYEVSHAQRRLWILSQLEAASPAYNIPLQLALEGDLDTNALSDAFAHVVRRHEALRTTFVSIDGDLRQIIHTPDKVQPMRQMDLSLQPGQLAELAKAEADEPFDLERGPLLRACLVRRGQMRHVLLFTIHHIVADGWSLRRIIKDIISFYEAAVTGVSVNIPPLSVQYRDYAAWQNRALESGAMRPQRDYWLTKLGGELPVLDLPMDTTRPTLQSFRGANLTIRLGGAESKALRDYARSCQASVFCVLLTVIKVLLARYTGQRDIIVGTVVAARNRAELEEQVGCYLNTLALRDFIDPGASFDTVIRQVRRTMLEALEHQDYPFDHLVDSLALSRDLSRAPLFDVMVIAQSAADLNGQMGEVGIAHLGQPSDMSKFDLTFDCEEGADFVNIGIEYNTDLFAADRVARMGEHLRVLLGAALRYPGLGVHALPLLPAREWNELIRMRNETEHASDLASALSRITTSMSRVPERVAAICGHVSITYEELGSRAAAIAAELRARGVRRGDVVGVMLARSIDLVAGLLGTWMAGAAYLPLDASYPAQRIAAMLADSRARLVICDPSTRDLLVDGVAVSLCLEGALPPAQIPLELPGPDELAYVIYTSGSTGQPKGVEISHRALANFLESMGREPGLHESDVLVAVTTICFDIAALELFLPLCVRACVVIASRETAANGEALLRLLQDSAATVLQATPVTFRMLLSAGWNGSPRLRTLCGGEALPRELSARLLECASEVWNLYGPTETTIWSSAYRLARRAPNELRTSPFEPIGRAIANTQLYVLDDWLEPVPIGIPGELFIGGLGVARAYRNRPELSAQRFLPDPFSTLPGARMYRTGDLVRSNADETWEFIGRDDHQVKLHGFRIELGEIEALLRAHPDVAEAVVIAREVDNGEEALAAYLVARDGREPRELGQFLSQRLPEYMIPSIFVALEAFPLTPNAKIDRIALRDIPVRPEHSGAFAAPRDEIESALAAIWQEVLGKRQVGIHDDFFELGGQSLKAARVIARIEQRLGARLTLLDLFRLRRVSSLSEIVRTKLANAPLKISLPTGSAAAAAESRPITAEELALLDG